MSKERKETKKNIEAFNLYTKLKLKGENDVFKKVADAFNVKEKTVYNWSYYFNWKDKFEEKQKEANRKALEKLARDMETQNIRMIQKAMQNLQVAEDNVMGSLEGMYSPKDYETMVKIYLLLTGQATERIETDNKTDIALTEKDKETLAKFSQGIVADIEGAEIGIKEEGEEEGDKSE